MAAPVAAPPGPVLTPRADPAAPPPQTRAGTPDEGPIRLVVRGLLWGLLQGALLYGGGVALLHLLHNRAMGLGPLDALALLGWCLLLYGGLAAAAMAVPLAVLAALPARRAGERALWLAATLFHATFWFFVSSYGLTYDQSPAWVHVAWQMVVWLIVRAAVALIVAAALAWLLVQGMAWLRVRRRLAIVAAALVALLAVVDVLVALVPSAAPATPPVPPLSPLDGHGTKVAIVGVDGADWRVAMPLVRAGRMPNLARLMAEGSWGPLATFPDSNSAVIWASIYSGRRPEAHTIADFYTMRLPGMSADLPGIYPVHRTFLKELVLRLQGLGVGELTPIDRARMRVPLVWEIVQSRGMPIGVVDGYYYSYPAPRLAEPASFFLSYGSDGTWQDAARAGHRPDAQDAGRYASPPALMGEVGPLLERPDFEWQTSALDLLLARHGQPPLVSLYSHEPDAIQHAAWRFHEPERFLRVDARRLAQGDPVVALYLKLDAWLGRVQHELAPGTVLVLVSDHGHSPTLFHSMDTQHRHGPPGILVLHGDAIRRGRLTRAQVLDVFPTVMALLGLPVADDDDGRVLDEALQPAFVAAHPLRHVSSWAGVPAPAPAIAIDPARRAEELAKLRALGYIH